MKKFTLLLIVGFLFSCSEGSSPPPALPPLEPPPAALPPLPPLPEPPPVLPVTLSVDFVELEATEDNSEAAFSFEARRTGTTRERIYVDLSYDESILDLVGDVVESPAGVYKVSFKTKPDLGGGIFRGSIGFRLCQDSRCDHLYEHSSQLLGYVLHAKLKDWVTFQRNAAHDGYVRMRLKPSEFSLAWDWSPPVAGELTRIAAAGDGVFVSSQNFDFPRTTNIYGIGAESGLTIWRYDVPRSEYIGAPAYADGTVAVMSMEISSSDNPLTVLDAETGESIATLSFASQWAEFMAPTPFDGHLYSTAGYYGGTVYDHDLSSYTENWTAQGNGYYVWDMATPTVDQERVYFYSGTHFDVFDRQTGTLVETIPDPHYIGHGYGYYAAPLLLSDGGVIAFSGTTDGGGLIEPGYATQRPLVRFSVDDATAVWRTSNVYYTRPAARDGVIYAARNQPAKLDAIDAQTGAVLWSWQPPVTDTSFHCDTVVTDNALLVSTNTSVYALDLANRNILWTHNGPGCITIAPSNHLIVAEGIVDEYANGTLRQINRLVAYDLN